MTELSAHAAETVRIPGAAAKTPKGYIPGLSVLIFGMYLALMTPAMVSMAFKIQHITTTPEEATAALGLVFGVGALFALVANPLAGRLSDRTTSRWGMRRPWILGGSVVGLGAFALIGFAESVWVILLAWCLAQAAMNAVIAAAYATIPDQVPDKQRGRVSGIVGVMTPIGILGGNFLVNYLAEDVARFVVPGLVGVVAAVLFALIVKDRRLAKTAADRFTIGQFFGSFFFNPRTHPDFGWTWITKFLVMFGYGGVATFLPFYLTEKFGLPEQEAISTILVASFASMVAMMVSAPIGGMLSDRIGKRRLFVTAAGVVMFIGLVLLAFAPDVTTVVIAQAIIGFGTGSFISVDLALATQVLPNPEDAAKDLGVLNMANALPQSIAPAIAPGIIALGASTAIGGYSMYYLFGALIVLLGAVLVYRIKGVK